MSGHVDEQVACVLDTAEGNRACACAPDNNLRKAFVRRCRSGALLQPFKSLFVRPEVWRALPKNEQARWVLRALQREHPEWVFCRESAAVALGLPVPESALDEVHVVSSAGRSESGSGRVRWHRAPHCSTVFANGVKATSLARTVFDCMRTQAFADSLAIADAALRASGHGRARFQAAFRAFGNIGHPTGSLPGARRAFRTMHYADRRSESAGESLARARMIELGFAQPRLQVPFERPLEPGRRFRVDFLWTRADGVQVVGEFDGMSKYEDPALLEGRVPARVLVEEQHREAQLTLLGMPVMRISFKDAVNPARFEALLDAYGIPRNEQARKCERRLATSGSLTAQFFTVVNVEDLGLRT